MERRELTHEDVADDLPAYLLGALDAEHCAAIATHLAECSTCQAERRRLEATIGALGTLAPPASPPPALRQRVLAQLDPPTAAAVDPPPALRERVLAQLDQPAERRSGGEPSRLRWLSWQRFGLAAAAVLLVGLGLWIAMLSRDLSDTRRELAAVQQRQAAQMILGEPASGISLISDTTGASYGTLYVGAGGHRAVLFVYNLPVPAPDQVYQIWLVRGDTRANAGVFSVDDRGRARVTIDASEPLPSFERLGITAEPGPDGSPGPTGPRVAGCPLSEAPASS